MSVRTTRERWIPCIASTSTRGMSGSAFRCKTSASEPRSSCHIHAVFLDGDAAGVRFRLPRGREAQADRVVAGIGRPSPGFAGEMRVRTWLVMALCGGSLGCDHATKAVAERSLGAGRVVSVVPHALELRYARNDDVAFSALSQWDLPHKGLVLLAAGLLVLAATLVMWVRHRRVYPARWDLADAGFALVVAGACGNLVDRALHGYVVDFIHLAHWPVFNVADVCIVVGLIALGLSRSRDPVVLSP